MTTREIQEIIEKALRETDVDAAKALILTAKTMFPKSFEM